MYRVYVTDTADQVLEQMVTGIQFVFRRPWWKFWHPQLTKAQVRRDISLALIGEYAPMQRYGIALSPAMERAIALEEGLIEADEPMTQAVKTQARLLLIHHQMMVFNPVWDM